MTKKHWIIFLKRGLVFGGFGPIIAAIVYLILSFTIDGFSVTGVNMFFAIISTYMLAFIQAGASIFNQIEEWSIAKSLLFHFTSIYISYSLCYLVNSWIPFNLTAFLIFTSAFVVLYFIIWFTVYFCVRAASKKFNEIISKQSI